MGSIWQKKTNASVLNIKNFKKNSLDKIFLKNKYFIIDNISSIIQNANLKERVDIEKNLLHFYNLIDEKKSYVIFTDIRPPKFWNLKLPDLKSRVMSCFNVGIKLPDDDLISVILAKNFSDKQVKIEKKHIDYIIKRIDRSYEKISQFIVLLDKYSLKKGSPFSLKLIKEVLKMM